MVQKTQRLGEPVQKMPQLKPCPFCGAEVSVLATHDKFWGVSYSYHHEPNRCPAAFLHYASYADKAEAIEAWNTRTERTCHVEAHDCGDGIKASYCSACGGFMYEDDRYCPNCGAKVVS